MRGPLHVTNGDRTVAGLERAGLGGELLAWRDVLHEGPVPATDAATLRDIRARFIADAGWAPRAETAAMLRERDERLAAALGERPVVLWFEHDAFACEASTGGSAACICMATTPGAGMRNSRR
jgi:hypothetical protein